MLSVLPLTDGRPAKHGVLNQKEENDKVWANEAEKKGEIMSKIFPQTIRNLPEADIPINGVKAYLSQSDTHQIIFMEFESDVNLPEHSHAAQVGFVLEGKIELIINGEMKTYTKGDRYYIPEGVPHSGKIHAGYADITFFGDPGRYSKK
jgi:quercetin dioxygenase-like cupin family protein